MKTIIIFSLLLSIITSCKKNDAGGDKTSPSVVITSPVANAVFTNGQTINVSATVTDNEKVNETHVHVYNNVTGNLLIDIHRNPLSPSYNLNETITAGTNIQYRLEVVAKDAASNTGKSTVMISCN